MYQRLGDAVLKNGETVEIGLVTPPFDEYAERLRKLLVHRGWEWGYQLGLSVEGKTDELENRFYVARRGDVFISNVCTFEKEGVGVLEHVWTPPEERLKGLCNAIFEKLMADFRARKVKLMLLGTGYDTPPYHIYRKFGFKGFFRGSGLMRWSSEPGFEKNYFGPGETKVVHATWSAWPRINALAAEPEEYVKSIAYGKFFRTYFEDACIYLMHGMANNPRICARLLERETNGAIVGYAWTVPHGLFPDAWLLDLYAHPNHKSGYEKLLAEMKWPAGKVVCYVDPAQRGKTRALRAAGFEREATLRGVLKTRKGFADLMMFAK